MKIIKISPQGQITIPKGLRSMCRTGSFAIYAEDDKIILRPLEIKIKQTEDEIIQNLLNKFTHGGTDPTGYS